MSAASPKSTRAGLGERRDSRSGGWDSDLGIVGKRELTSGFRRRVVSWKDAALAVTAGLLLSFMAVPLARGAHDDAQADTLVELIGRVERAVWSHHRDTERLAVEDSCADPADRALRMLSMDSGHPGWSGPYLRAPLTPDQSPFGSFLVVEDDLTGRRAPTWGGRFALAGGREPHRGAGQLLAIGDVPPEVARLVDERLEQSAASKWHRDGRVQWHPASSTLMVFLLDI